MSRPREFCGAMSIDGLVYALGGSDGPSVVKSCEVYDPDCDSWRKISDMITARCYFGIGELERDIVVVGGFDNHDADMLKVEKYNIKDDKWIELEDINIQISSINCTVIQNMELEKIRKYSQ